MFQTLHPSATGRKIMEVFNDVRADRFRRPVFRRMEEVDRERRRQLEAEGSIEMTERYVECGSSTATIHHPIFV